jgi:hypothetical protein
MVRSLIDEPLSRDGATIEPVTVNYAPTWDNPTSSWWVKADRARVHIDALSRLVDEYRNSDPYSLTPEKTDDPNRTAYRLRFLKPVPVEISATVGDVLSNLRGALESLAYEIARIGQDGTLTGEQERYPTFPICPTPEAFEEFFKHKKIGPLYNDRARAALRSVQPFVNLEAVFNDGTPMDITYEEWFLLSELHQLNVLWNIDKHRRLALLALWPDTLIWWTSKGPTQRRLIPGDGTMLDGSILFYIDGFDEGQGDGITHEFNLVATDNPGFPNTGVGSAENVVSLLDRMHQHITHQVFAQVFTLMSH